MQKTLAPYVRATFNMVVVKSKCVHKKLQKKKIIIIQKVSGLSLMIWCKDKNPFKLILII